MEPESVHSGRASVATGGPGDGDRPGGADVSARCDSRGDPRHLQGVPGRVLARRRPAPRVPRGVRPGADRGRLARLPDPRGVRRGRTWDHRGQHHPRRAEPVRRELGGLPRPDVHHGHAAQARQRGAEAPLPAEDRERRAAAPGVRRDRAERRLRDDPDPDDGCPARRHVRRERPEDLDLAGAPVRPAAAAGPDHAVRRAGRQDARPLGLPGRSARRPAARWTSGRSTR